MAKSRTVGQLEVPADDPLAAEHAAVVNWVEDAAQALGEHSYWQSIELKTRPTGEFLLAGLPNSPAGLCWRQWLRRSIGTVRRMPCVRARRLIWSGRTSTTNRISRQSGCAVGRRKRWSARS